MEFRLYHYWRSSSSWRVRWALVAKGIDCEYVHVDLLNGESEAPPHRERNPFGYVPVLELLKKPAGKNLLTESVAILEYLEERYPAPPLLPKGAEERAWVRALVEAINAGTQPLQNLTAQILYAPDGSPNFAEKRKTWAQYWIQNGLEAYEKLCSPRAGSFSFGNTLTFADLCLVPQCYNALRNEVALETYPTIFRVYQNALQDPAYLASEPERFKPST